jgi:O-antigen/teichoic acid export membrane protein
LWQSWLVYSLSSLASRLVGFLMLPIYTRILSPEEYGIRAMVTVGMDIIGMVCWLGITTAMVRHYTGESNGARRGEAVSTAYMTGALALGTGVAVGILAAPWLSIALLGDAAYAAYVRLGLVTLFFTNTMEIGLAYTRLRRRVRTVVLVSLGTLTLTVISNIALVVILRWGVVGIFYSEILTYGIFSIAIARLTLREVGLRFSWPLGRRMIAYGAPLTLMPASWLLINRTASVFLTHHESIAAAGIYALAMQCAQVLLVTVVWPFREAWDPGQFEIARDPNGARTYRRMFQGFTFAIIMAGLVFAVAAEDVIRIMAAPRFHSAAAVVPLLVAAHVVMGISLFFKTGLLVKNSTVVLGWIGLLTALVSVGASAILVPLYSATGAALSRLITLLIMAALTYVMAQRVWPQHPDFAALGKVTALAMAGFAASRLIPASPVLVAVALKAALVVVVAGLGVLVGAIDRRDPQRLLAAVHARLLGRRQQGPAPARP